MLVSNDTIYWDVLLPKYNSIYVITNYSGVGKGCSSLNNCHQKGRCNFCSETCECFNGYGASNDTIAIGSSISTSCSQRKSFAMIEFDQNRLYFNNGILLIHCAPGVCPAGKAIGDMPTSSNTAHALAECSNRGVCDRTTGVCNCFPPFIGSACERSKCLCHYTYMYLIGAQ